MAVRRIESDNAREPRIRRAVAGLGFGLRKSHRRGPDSPDGAWPWGYSLDLDDLEDWLAESPVATSSRP
jgi:hypothetical protein